MRVHTLAREQLLGPSPDRVFSFFADALNLERITPPWLGFRVLGQDPAEMHAGTLIDYRLRLHGVSLRWRTEIVLWDPPRRFIDVQLCGPYRLWHHTHGFEPAGTGTLMRDVVRYSLPLGLVGSLAHVAFVRRDLRRIFDFRHDEVARVLGGRERRGGSR